MKYKISLSTYNMDIIEAFSALGNRKSQFVEQALLNFIGTEKGKNTLRLIVEQYREIGYNTQKNKKPLSEQKKHVEAESARISVDSFLE